MKKTKIIATVGPSSDTQQKILGLYNAGVNIIRINYSHSNYKYFGKILDTVKELNSSGKTNLSILTDTKGPEIRTITIENKIKILKNEIFILTNTYYQKKVKSNDKNIVVCDYDYIVEDLKIGHIVDIDTGLLKAKIIDKTDTYLVCKALNKHLIGSKRHVNLPGIKIKLPGITKTDKEDIDFAVNKGTDYIALSFVRNKQNIIELRKYLKKIEASINIQIISKIENQEALDNLDEIIEYSDGIMIARGDLGAEVPFETLPIIQRDIANKCKEKGKFFIIATQILESMIENPIATRAEVTDIFNACMQKADSLMLSGETAVGKYPIETIETMSRVINFSEGQAPNKHDYFSVNIGKNENRKKLVQNAVNTAENLESKALIIFTDVGFMAKTVAAFRSSLPVHVFTFTDNLLKKLNILFGLNNHLIPKGCHKENIVNAITLLKKEKLLKTGDEVVIVYGIEEECNTIPSIQIRVV